MSEKAAPDGSLLASLRSYAALEDGKLVLRHLLNRAVRAVSETAGL